MFDQNNGRKKPLSERERETLKLLRESLPEYEIFPHLRLADAGKTDGQRINSDASYHLDFVICDIYGHTVATVELADTAHDNLPAQSRDKNNNGWRQGAGINLIRIRQPQEASAIRQLIAERKAEAAAPHAWMLTQSLKPEAEGNTKSSQRIVAAIAIPVISMFALWMMFNIMGADFQKQPSANVPPAQQRSGQQAEQEASLFRQHNLSTLQPTESVLAREKSARKCTRPDGTSDDHAVLCMKNHHVSLPKNGAP